MRVVASEEARGLIAERGGRLYVSVRTGRCCRAVRTLVARTDVAHAAEYRPAGGAAGFELFLPRALARLPEELHVEVRRYPSRIEAYWNGCAWVV